MATTVDRAMAKAAAALLPGLLPTPPKSTMIALCRYVIPPASVASNTNPGRADSVERWDAHKNDRKHPCSPASSNGSSSNSGSSGRASSCVDRWDSKKSSGGSTPTPSHGSSKIPDRASSCVKWDRNSKRPPSRASSADRWDAQKKARSAQQNDAGNVHEGRTGEQEINETPKDEMMEMDVTVVRADPALSGPRFFVSPEPDMLPVPAFIASPEPAMLPVPAFLMAH